MYKRFSFEGQIHETLDCVPLTVRRKLDLAGFKISLRGWLQLSRAERLALCHLPVDLPGDLDVYRSVMAEFCATRSIELGPLVVPPPHERPWNAGQVPTMVRDRARASGTAIDDAAWTRLDEESRYALWKLADPKHREERLAAALHELGFLASGAPTS